MIKQELKRVVEEDKKNGLKTITYLDEGGVKQKSISFDIDGSNTSYMVVVYDGGKKKESFWFNNNQIEQYVVYKEEGNGEVLDEVYDFVYDKQSLLRGVKKRFNFNQGNILEKPTGQYLVDSKYMEFCLSLAKDIMSIKYGDNLDFLIDTEQVENNDIIDNNRLPFVNEVKTFIKYLSEKKEYKNKFDEIDDCNNKIEQIREYRKYIHEEEKKEQERYRSKIEDNNNLSGISDEKKKQNEESIQRDFKTWKDNIGECERQINIINNKITDNKEKVENEVREEAKDKIKQLLNKVSQYKEEIITEINKEKGDIILGVSQVEEKKILKQGSKIEEQHKIAKYGDNKENDINEIILEVKQIKEEHKSDKSVENKENEISNFSNNAKYKKNFVIGELGNFEVSSSNMKKDIENQKNRISNFIMKGDKITAEDITADALDAYFKDKDTFKHKGTWWSRSFGTETRQRTRFNKLCEILLKLEKEIGKSTDFSENLKKKNYNEIGDSIKKLFADATLVKDILEKLNKVGRVKGDKVMFNNGNRNIANKYAKNNLLLLQQFIAQKLSGVSGCYCN